MVKRWRRERGSTLNTVVTGVILVLVMVCLYYTRPSAASSHSSDSERIAKMAMSTASLWMMEHHQHEIEEGLEKGDFGEALEEAEELVPWMQGTSWLAELEAPAKAAIEAVQMVVHKLKARDLEGAKSAVKTMKMKFHHLHHELMEAVAKGGKSGGHKQHR